MRNEKPKRPREPFRLLRRRFESNENQYDEFLSFTLHNRFKNYGVDSNCHQSTDAVAVNLPTQVQGRSPGKSQRLRTCGYIYDGGTSSRLLRDFSSHSTFHGKPSPRLDRLAVRWLSGSEPFTLATESRFKTPFYLSVRKRSDLTDRTSYFRFCGSLPVIETKCRYPDQPMQSQSTYRPRSKGGALARANGCELVATFTMEVQVRVSCEIFHLTAHFTANHRRA